MLRKHVQIWMNQREWRQEPAEFCAIIIWWYRIHRERRAHKMSWNRKWDCVWYFYFKIKLNSSICKTSNNFGWAARNRNIVAIPALLFVSLFDIFLLRILFNVWKSNETNSIESNTRARVCDCECVYSTNETVD